MKDLIQEYKQGRLELERRIREIEGKIQRKTEMDEELELLQRDKSIIASMRRDMTEAISLMRSNLYRLRGLNKNANRTENKVFYLDPDVLTYNQSSYDPTEEDLDPVDEDRIRDAVIDELRQVMEKNMQYLTNKQRSTIDRWIYQGKSISEIAREDGVSKPSVRERIYGNKTHQGALRKLKYGKLGESK